MQKLLVNLHDLLWSFRFTVFGFWQIVKKANSIKVDRIKCCCQVPKILVQVGFMIVGNLEINDAIWHKSL